MANPKRKPKPRNARNQAYDSNRPEDAAAIIVLREAGFSIRQRQPANVVRALASLTKAQRLQLRGAAEQTGTAKVRYAGAGIVEHRKMLEGSEEREVESVTVRRSTLPRCLWWLPRDLIDALEDYQSLWERAMSVQTGSLSPRLSGGGVNTDPYDEEALEAWRAARARMSRREAAAVERALRLSDDALISTDGSFALRAGAGRLAEYFEWNSVG